MKTINNYFPFVQLTYLFALVFLYSCEPKELNKREYLSWVESESNGLKQSKEINGIRYEIQFKPIEYILENESISIKDYQSRKEELGELKYFNLEINPSERTEKSILKTRSSSYADYQKGIYHLAYKFKEYIQLTQDSDTAECVLFHFVRDHGLSSKLRFALGFDVKDMKGDMTLLINDELFQNGMVKFYYDVDLLNDIPRLKYNSNAI